MSLSNLIPWLAVLSIGVAAFFVGLYFQGKEREHRAEVERVRMENRALLNSLLGHAGYAPVDFPKEAPKPVNLPRKMTWFQRQRMTERESEQRILERSKKCSA